LTPTVDSGRQAGASCCGTFTGTRVIDVSQTSGRTTIRGRLGAFRARSCKQDNYGYMKLPGRFPTRRMSWQSFFPVLLGVALVAAVGGCSSSSDGEPPCLPPAYSVSPASAKPGDTVTVAAAGAACNPRYGANAQIHLSVTDESGAKVINTTAPMTDSGEFTYTFTVPAEIAVGEATVTAMPYNVDWCDDTGRNNRAGGPVQFQLASCAMPEMPLTITR